MSTVKRTERGWPGHFIASRRCHFRRNTLLECGETRIVVSTVGRMELDDRYVEIGHQRFYETMAFHATLDVRFWDADTGKEVTFASPWSISELDAEDRANDMHEQVVAELTEALQEGRIT